MNATLLFAANLAAVVVSIGSLLCSLLGHGNEVVSFGEINEGLWVSCAFGECHSYDFEFSPNDFKSKILSARAFLIASNMAGLVTLSAFVGSIFIRRREIRLFGSVTATGYGLLLMIACALMTSAFNVDDILKDYYGWTFVTPWFGWVLSIPLVLIGGFLYLTFPV